MYRLSQVLVSVVHSYYDLFTYFWFLLSSYIICDYLQLYILSTCFVLTSPMGTCISCCRHRYLSSYTVQVGARIPSCFWWAPVCFGAFRVISSHFWYCIEVSYMAGCVQTLVKLCVLSRGFVDLMYNQGGVLLIDVMAPTPKYCIYIYMCARAYTGDYFLLYATWCFPNFGLT